MSGDAMDLLDGAAALLRALAPSLSAEARYLALLSANAVATARRDVALAPRVAAARAALGADPAAITAAIRAGRHDDDAALHARLVALAELRAWVADPKAAPGVAP